MEHEGRLCIMDGLHRLAKAMMQGREDVAVRRIPKSALNAEQTPLPHAMAGATLLTNLQTHPLRRPMVNAFSDGGLFALGFADPDGGPPASPVNKEGTDSRNAPPRRTSNGAL